MRILGLSSYYHDSAAALIEDGKIVAAAQEERFTRKKHDASFPKEAIKFCLEAAGIPGEQAFDSIDYIAFYDKPFLKFERLLETYVSFAPRGLRAFKRSLPLWIGEKLMQKDLLHKELSAQLGAGPWKEKLLFSEHHLSHGASAFYPSPFSEALILTLDGVGEWTTSSVALGGGNKIEIIKEIHFPHSLGLLYSAFTYFCGFKVNSGEYKLMGLAPYGEPRFFSQIMKQLIDVKSDGSYRLNISYFDYCAGSTMTNEAFAQLFGIQARDPEGPLQQIHMDLAASVQKVTEEVVLRMTRSLVQETGIRDFCLAGGVALNCVANGKILQDGVVKRLWIQPAAGDSGGAVGAALAAYHSHLQQERKPHPRDSMQGSYLGPSFSEEALEAALKEAGAIYQKLPKEQLVSETALALSQGKAVGWFQGAMEYGPRALGARSILADPRPTDMQSKLNLKVKFRESFRPFAPAVLSEKATEWFALEEDSPYMLLVAEVREEKRTALSEKKGESKGFERLKTARSEIPAVTHVDFSARVQTVHKETNPLFHALISEFDRITGCPILVNTSFNVRGEPIVCTPQDAFRCFMGTDLDLLAMGNFLLKKEEQTAKAREDYQHQFTAD
jgi:carbamoyltransferase